MITTRNARTTPRRAARRPGAPDPAPGGAPGITGRLLLSPWTLAALFGLVVLPWLLAHRIGRYDVETDFFGEYAPHAALFRSGTIPESFPYRGPGYHLVLALAGIVIPDAFLAGRVLALLSGATFVGLLAAWVGRHAGRGAGALAALFVALQPLTLLYSWTVGNDMFFAALVMATVVLLDRSLDPPGAGVTRDRWQPLLAGLVAGYAGLTRPNGIFLLPAGLLAAVMLRRTAAPPAGRLALGFAAGWLVPMLLWPLAFHTAHDRWPAAMNFRNMTEAIFEDDAKISADVYRQTVERQVGSFDAFLRTYGRRILPVALANVPKHLLTGAREVHGPALAALAAVGLALLALRRAARALWLLPLTGALAFLILLFAIDEARYALLLSAPVAFLAAMALFDPATRRLRVFPRMPPRLVPMVAAAVIVVVAVPTALQAFRVCGSRLEVEQSVRNVPLASAYLRTRADVPGPVAARKPHIAWWSGRPYRGLPAAAPEALADSLRARGAAFVYLSYVELEMQPQLYPLLAPEASRPGLELVYVQDTLPIGTLFRVLPAGATTPPPNPGLVAALGRLNVALSRSGLRDRVTRRNITDLMQRGKLLISQGRIEDACAEFEQATREAPTMKEAHYAYGVVAVALGRWAQGLEALETAQRLGMPEEELTLYIGQAQYGLGRPDVGAERAQQVLARSPNDALALYLLAVCREAQGRIPEAAELSKRARAAGFSDPGDLDALDARLALRMPR